MSNNNNTVTTAVTNPKNLLSKSVISNNNNLSAIAGPALVNHPELLANPLLTTSIIRKPITSTSIFDNKTIQSQNNLHYKQVLGQSSSVASSVDPCNELIKINSNVVNNNSISFHNNINLLNNNNANIPLPNNIDFELSDSIYHNSNEVKSFSLPNH